jgi:hypothetical protein
VPMGVAMCLAWSFVDGLVCLARDMLFVVVEEVIDGRAGWVWFMVEA